MDWGDITFGIGTDIVGCDGGDCSPEGIDRRFRFFTFLLWAVLIAGFVWILILAFKPEPASYYTQSAGIVAPPQHRPAKIAPPHHRAGKIAQHHAAKPADQSRQHAHAHSVQNRHLAKSASASPAQPQVRATHSDVNRSHRRALQALGTDKSVAHTIGGSN